MPPKYTFQLSPGFNGSLAGSFVDTTDVDPNIAAILTSAAEAPIISYHAEFESIVGPSPKLQLLAGPVDRDFALEGGVYVQETNSVWFTGIGSGEAGHVVSPSISATTQFISPSMMPSYCARTVALTIRAMSTSRFGATAP